MPESIPEVIAIIISLICIVLNLLRFRKICKNIKRKRKLLKSLNYKTEI